MNSAVQRRSSQDQQIEDLLKLQKPKLYAFNKNGFRESATRPRILRLPEVEDLTQLSKSQIYALIKKAAFPKQISLTGSRAVGFIEEEILEWIRSRPRCHPDRSPQFIWVENGDVVQAGGAT